ncbi:helix-turn-helix domain-containing protein [Streptomyces fuscichromogenes]|uniref:helix-turn-helix domain-containing protein n=1 Tax=Streptomyces fuscichromogenes TaxID=1324013 RepID=UPI00380B198D
MSARGTAVVSSTSLLSENWIPQHAFAEDLPCRLDVTTAGSNDLVMVAIAFMKHHGRVNVVAQELRMHRNTGRARVGGIEAAIGTDLDDPTVRFSLRAVGRASDREGPPGLARHRRGL